MTGQNFNGKPAASKKQFESKKNKNQQTNACWQAWFT